MRAGLRHAQKPVRILRYALYPNLEMQMRPGGASGSSHFGDFLAPAYKLARLDEQSGSVGIPRGEFVAMVNLDQVAILRV